MERIVVFVAVSELVDLGLELGHQKVLLVWVIADWVVVLRQEAILRSFERPIVIRLITIISFTLPPHLELRPKDKN